jgi:hypothetical protein
MSAELAASTVTPGNTAPLASLTTPAIALCACAGEIPAARTAIRNAIAIVHFMIPPVVLESAEYVRIGSRCLAAGM